MNALIWAAAVWIMLVLTFALFATLKLDWSFVYAHFDKFLLVFLILFYSLIGWHASYRVTFTNNPFVQKFADAMLDNQKLVIGALLGLITGRAIQSKLDSDANGAAAALASLPAAPADSIAPVLPVQVSIPAEEKKKV